MTRFSLLAPPGFVVSPPLPQQISDHMPGRVGKQCRERYLNHLDPSLRHGPWTEEEERLLLSLHARLNNQWAEIARQIPGANEKKVADGGGFGCAASYGSVVGISLLCNRLWSLPWMLVFRRVPDFHWMKGAPP